MGEPQTIPLKVSGRIVEPLRFLIRKKPRQGSLGEVRRTGPKTAEVLYTPAPGAKVGEDFFTYAVQSVDSPVSAPARIDIDLSLRPAVLEYPRNLDFGAVPLGDSARLDILVSNTGGKAAALQIRANPPWTLAETPPDGIKGGGQAVIGLIFEPGASGDFSERLPLTTEGGDFIVLRASSQGAFSWPSQGLIIATEARSHSGHSIPFTNLTGTDRIIEFEWPQGVEAPKHVEISANSTVPVPMALENVPPSFSFAGPVAFRSGNFTASFPLAVRPAPANLVFEPPEALDLGEMPVNGTARGKLLVSNTGGLPAGLRMEKPQQLAIRPDPSGVLIGPGDTVEFEISVNPSKPGNFSLALHLAPPDGAWHSLKVHYSVRAPQPVKNLLRIPAMTPKSEAAPEPLADIPLVEKCVLVDSTFHSVTISWKVPSPDIKEFFIERRGIRPGEGGAPVEEWTRWEPVNIEISGATATARFRKLPAGTFWHVRIRSVDDQDRVTAPPRGFFRIATQPLPPLLPDWFWWVAMPVALALLYRLWKKIRASRVENLDARIENLGPS